MKYTLKGQLQSAICDGSKFAIAHTLIRVYGLNEKTKDSTPFTNARSEELTQVFEEAEASNMKSQLLAETKTNASGNYEFEFEDGRTGYSGGAVAITLVYNEIPDYGQRDTSATKGFRKFEILLDILQPNWDNSENEMLAIWDHLMTKRIWCYILERLDIWVICGLLTNCESQAPLEGIEVIAIDDDIITDDVLGSSITNENGRFCIYYRSKDFKKTFLSPIINIETTPFSASGYGPDIYFKFALSGTEIYAESHTAAHSASRRNVGNCLCVNLCLKSDHGGGPDDVPAAFYNIGYARKYHPIFNIDPATGKTTDKLEAGWNGQAFFSTLDLRGSNSKEFNGAAMEYKFQFAEVSDPSVDISTISVWTDVTPADIARTEIASRLTQFLPIKYDAYVIHGNNMATVYGNEIEVLFNGNWIIAPQYSGSGFDISFNGSLIKLISDNLASGNVDKSALTQGTSSAPLQKNRYFALRMRKRQVGNPASEVMAGFSRPLAIFNTLYIVPQGGSWLPTTQTELGVAAVDLQELIGGGCNNIEDSITVKYTAANPNLGGVSISFSGQGATNNFQPIVFPTPGEEAFGTSNYLGDFSLLENCAYEILLSAELKLTNGEDQHHNIWDRVLFCR